MDVRTRALLIGLAGLVGTVAYLGLTVYPLDYGPVESALLAGALVLFAVYEIVLDDASFGQDSG